MPRVTATPFKKYSLGVEAINWTMPRLKQKRVIGYLEKTLKHLIDQLGQKPHNLPYHEQGEAARRFLNDYLHRITSDSRNSQVFKQFLIFKANLAIILI